MYIIQPAHRTGVSYYSTSLLPSDDSWPVFPVPQMRALGPILILGPRSKS